MRRRGARYDQKLQPSTKLSKEKKREKERIIRKEAKDVNFKERLSKWKLSIRRPETRNVRKKGS